MAEKYSKIDYRAVGDRIKTLRGEESQSDFGKKFDKTYMDIGRIERGEVRPSVELLFNICMFYNKDMAWLLMGAAEQVAETSPPYYNVSTDPELKEINEWLRANPKDKKLFLKLVKVKKDVGEAFEGLEFKIILKEET